MGVSPSLAGTVPESLRRFAAMGWVASFGESGGDSMQNSLASAADRRNSPQRDSSRAGTEFDICDEPHDSLENARAMAYWGPSGGQASLVCLVRRPREHRALATPVFLA